MSEETVYICDKLEGLDDVKPATKPCRKAVTEDDGVEVTLEFSAPSGAQSVSVKFCGSRCANFWLKRQRVTA